MHYYSRQSLSHFVALLLFVLAMSSVQAQKIDVLNTNGISDVWEYTYSAVGVDPNADDDGDGVPNLLESIAGTNPFDSNSVPRLAFTTPTSTNFALSLPCALGKRYEWQSVQGLAGLASSNWVTESSFVARSGAFVT